MMITCIIIFSLLRQTTCSLLTAAHTQTHTHTGDPEHTTHIDSSTYTQCHVKRTSVLLKDVPISGEECMQTDTRREECVTQVI